MRQPFLDLPIQRKMLVLLAGAGALALIVGTLLVLLYEVTSFRPRIEGEMRSTANIMADINMPALEFEDSTLAMEYLNFLHFQPEYEIGAIYRENGRLFAMYVDPDIASGSQLDRLRGSMVTMPKAGVTHGVSSIDLVQPAKHGAQIMGYVFLRYKYPPLWERMPQYTIVFVSLAAVVVVLGLILLWTSRHVIAKPLQNLSRAAEQISQQQQMDVRVEYNAADELGQLTTAFNRMLDTIAERDLALRQLNSELEQRVEQRTQELALAQTELVRSEKLASLGSLVAGVAHELNTPIGNALTVASSMAYQRNHFMAQYQSGQVRKSTLEEFINTISESADLIERNLDRAGQLIAHFKQVAVDQTSAQQRDFDLQLFMEELLQTLYPMYKHTPHQVLVDIPEGIVMVSYPGPLGQVITNFLNNAMLHAFENIPRGEIRISASLNETGEMVELCFSDNGKGIPEENIGRVFDPFFTTKLGQGGSGLGLNIVHNIVHDLLGGTIRIETAAGQGTKFIMTLPCKAPHMPAQAQAMVAA